MSDAPERRRWSRTGPLTVGQVEQALLQNLDDQEDLNEHLAELKDDKDEKRREAELEYAKTFLVVKGTMPEKREKAKKTAHSKTREAEQAETVYETAKRRFAILAQGQDTLRTISANARGQS